MKIHFRPYLVEYFLEWEIFQIHVVQHVWNVTAHAQKPDFVFRAKRTNPFKSAGGRQFSRLLAAEVCASAVVMLDTPCSEVMRRVLATHSTHMFPLHFPYRASQCAITFQLSSTKIQKTHFLLNDPGFWKSCRLWDNLERKYIVQPKGPQTTIWLIRISRWIPKATNTHSEYVIIIAFPLQQLLHERASLLRFTCIVLSCYCTMTRLA